ncbi:MAG: hypothetical protein R3F56_02125 [Planctomycetota bacterium]
MIDSRDALAILDTVWRLLPPDRPAPRARPLLRRGVLHGHVADSGPPTEAAAPAGTQTEDAGVDLSEAFAGAEPIALPGVLRPALTPLREDIERSLELFEHLRQGGRFLDVVLAALDDVPDLRPEGSTVDRLDAREIEKVYVSGLVDGRCARGGRDVWAKLQWIARDEADLSLRVRFSCGTEHLHDWPHHVEGQKWANRLAEVLFPEGAALTDSAELDDVLRAVVGAAPRLSERIVYSNAPAGGAVFHHDADATQRAVLYGQLAGATAWLALPATALAEAVVSHARETGRADLPQARADALRRLDQEDDHALFGLLNEDPAFTARLAADGWLMVLEAGDALLLPSHDREHTAWHSVFALGDAPSLAHSYGVFAGDDPAD